MSRGKYQSGYCRQCTDNPCSCGSGSLTAGQLALIAAADSAKPKRQREGTKRGKKEHGRATKHGSVKMGRTGRYL